MREVILPMSDEEFKAYLDKAKKKVDDMKNDGMGYISITCQLAKGVANEDPEVVFTSRQLERILDLAK